jgi:predicted KAP-like P-loop ATPase
MPNGTEWQLAPDQPPEDRSGDEYDRVSFAEKLVEALDRLPESSFVVGLEGIWGCGKTAILNFIAEIAQLIEPEQRPIVVRFNPWWFTGKEDLIHRFFEAVAAATNSASHVNQARRTEAATALQKMGKISTPVLDLLAIAIGKDRGEPLKEMVSKLLGVGEAALQADELTLDALKNNAAEELREMHRPIWVILDDVDRLLPHEVLEVLTMIRGVGDLPNVRYLLAYDRVQLERRLATAIGGSEDDARDYINKIVQLSFPIPSPANWRLREAALSGVREILKGHYQTDDVNGFDAVLSVTIGTLIRTPRDVKRLLNAFGSALNMVGRELFAADLFALELLRLEFPRLYDILPLHRKWLLRTCLESSWTRFLNANQTLKMT